MNWSSASLEELCKINVGRTPARANPEFWGTGEPWLSIADMKQGRIIRSTKEQITEQAARSGRVVDSGTVLLSFKLSIGKVAVAGIPLYTNEAIAALPIERPDRILPEFLVRALEAQDLAGGSNRAAMGATLNKAKLKQIQIPLPPLDEQRRIARILDHADALRAKRRQALAHLTDLTQSIFRDLFGGRQDPSCRLDELIDETDRMNYGVIQPGDDVPDGVPLIRISNLANGAVDRAGLKHISSDIEGNYLRSRIRGNEILVSSVGSIGLVGVVSDADVGSNIARAITRVPITDPVLRSYVAAYLTTEVPQRYFVSELRTVAQPTLNVRQLAATQVPVPPRSLQTEFLRRLQIVVALRATQVSAGKKEHDLFDSLQSRAFRGGL